MSSQPPVEKRGRPSSYLWAAALAALAAFAAVYVTFGGADNQGTRLTAGSEAQSGPDTGPQGGADTKTGTNPLAAGTMATFVFKTSPVPLAEVNFLDGSGNAMDLTAFRGKVVLLNVWATWCAPCREEMPALSKLQAELGSDKFQVVALAVDKSGVEGARKFLDDIKADNLEAYADPTMKGGTRLGVIGMPTTILINGEGQEIGRLIGPAHWDSPEAKKLIEANL
ncbi:MAG TPA: TlpA disulfide reductase family protein [Hyphomicrobium sp.]|nr:TlpA disulfide reductase family protein [Hyphomicrobium sp.]